MKTQIITLESHDDLISVRDRLSWVKTPRVLLVWPKFERVSLRLLDLKVLQRHADSLGAQLGLVTRIASVRRDAESLGIPVFDSTASAQKDVWPDSATRQVRKPKPPRKDLREQRESIHVKEPAWQTSLLGRVLVFSVGVLAFLMVAGLFIPRATVTIYPEEQVQSILIPVAAGDANSEVSAAGGVPAYQLSVIVGTEQSLQVVNRIPIPKTRSKGIVRFQNQGQAEVRIEAGTIVETAAQPPVQFVTLNPTLIGAGEDVFVDVPVEAVLPGENGNVDANAIVNINGPLSLSLVAGNPQPMKGGADEMLVGAGEADRQTLKDAVLAQLRTDAEMKIRAQIGAGDLFLPDTFEAVNILVENFTPQPGQPGETLKLNMQVEFSARYVKDEDLKNLAFLALPSVPDGFSSAGDASYLVITEPSSDANNKTHFEIQATRTLLRQTDFFAVYSAIRGKSLQPALDDLSRLSARQPAEIEISPSWWPRLPLNPLGVTVNIR